IKTVPKRGYKLLVAAEVSTEVEKLPASTEEKAQRAAYAGWRWGAVCAGLMVALTGLWTLTQKRSEPAVVIDMAPLCFDSMDADGSGYLVIVSLLQTAGGVVEYPARFDLRQNEVLSAVDAPLCDIAGALGTNLDSTGG